MNDYELVTILHPDIKDEDVGDTVERLNQFVTGRGGEVQNVDQWGRRRLAYPIARQFEGTYVVSHLQMQPANAAELEANLRISEDVLRHLLVKYNPAERAAAIAAMQRRRPRPAFDEQGGPAGPMDGVATPPQPAGSVEPAAAHTETDSATPPQPADSVEPAAAQTETDSGGAVTEAPSAAEAESAPQVDSAPASESAAEHPTSQPE